MSGDMTAAGTGETRDSRMGGFWRLERHRYYVPVRADEVKRGDVYANGASVTLSRKAKPADVIYGLPKVNDEEVPLEEVWHIRRGKGFSVTCCRERPVIVGRRVSGGPGTDVWRDPYTPKPPTVIPKPAYRCRTVSVRQDHHDAIAARAAVQGRSWSAVLRDVLTAGLRALER